MGGELPEEVRAAGTRGRIAHRRATEIDFLNGGVVLFGREHGVPTPLNEALTALIKGLERSWAS